MNTYIPPYSAAQYQQPMQQVQQPVQPQQQVNNCSLMTIFVNSDQDVNMYPVAAGTTVMLISFETGKFWLKSRGTNGVPMPLREFKFKEETAAPIIQNGGVSRDEFNSLSAKLDKLIADLGGGKNE